MRYCLEQLDGLIIEDDDTARLQPCKSPVWDTAITLRALADSGLPADHDSVETAASTGCSTTKFSRRGDWSKTVDVPRRAAGSSSTTTSSIPTSTTRRWW